jgi:hypothetical protein
MDGSDGSYVFGRADGLPGTYGAAISSHRRLRGWLRVTCDVPCRRYRRVQIRPGAEATNLTPNLSR